MATSTIRSRPIGNRLWRRAVLMPAQLAWLAALLAVSACGPAPGGRADKASAAAPPAVSPAPAPVTLESTLRLDPDAEEIPFYPQIAESRYGDTVAVWEQFDGARYNIWANARRAHQQWGQATLLEASDAGHAYNPQVAISAQGRAMAVWVQADDAAHRYDIQVSRFDAQAGWSLPVQLSVGSAGQAWSPHIAVDDQGNGVAVWQQSNGRHVNIWASRYQSGAGWESARQIESGTASLGAPTVAMDRDGHATALWPRFVGGKSEIWTNRVTARGNWGVAARIETVPGHAHNPAIDIGADGRVRATWQSADGVHTTAWSARYRAEEAGGVKVKRCREGSSLGVSALAKKCRGD